MRLENINILGVDLGYDSAKFKTKEQELIFPSLAEEDVEGVLSDTSFKALENKDTAANKFDSEKMIIQLQDEAIKGGTGKKFNTYRVGDYVLNQHSASIAYSLSENKYQDPEEFAKLLSGICMLFPKADKIVINHLITGLPIKYYKNHKKSFRRKLENNFKVRFKNINNEFIPKEIEINKATVIPQGLASYYDFIMNKEGLVTTNIEGGLGIVDLGGLTIDCVAFNEGELIKDSPISFSGGVRKRIFKKIQDALAIDISQDIIKKQILAGKDYIKVRQEKYDFSSIKEQTVDKLARDIALQIKNRWESFLMIDRILITGGASVLLFEPLNNYLDTFPCDQINKKPQFSNCRGYVKLGLALKKKKKEEVKQRINKEKNANLNKTKNTSSTPQEMPIPKKEIAVNQNE